ncbi:MAG TPA: histidine phosphatase family protein [Stellaceae bacterium]|jgi:probable phosphoglycerate mutase|nr:histidine phosphatase family protein [Stellaceae bacterium]
MTVFHLLRHGEHNVQGRICAGRMAGVVLSEKGRAEAEGAARRLAGAGIAAIYASPLERTRETAAIVGRRLGLPVSILDDLAELDFGEWTGKTFDEVRLDSRWPEWAAHRSISCIPGGETMREVQRRVVEALIEMRAQHPDESVVVVSHGDVIRAALVFALGMPLDFYGRIEVATASLSTLRIDAGGIRVIAVNERLPA